MKIEKGYKVVLPIGGGVRRSVVMIHEGVVRYRVGKWAHPQKGCGFLCVFALAKDARTFVSAYGFAGREEVWGCLFERSRSRKVWTSSTRSTCDFLPQGTVLAKRVKLVRKLVRQWK